MPAASTRCCTARISSATSCVRGSGMTTMRGTRTARTAMARRRGGRPIHGWVVLDKPLGLTSSQAVGAVRRITGAAKAGPGGTLDPLATGGRPIALGGATQTGGWALAGRQIYRLRHPLGDALRPDYRHGAIAATSAAP